MRILVAHSRYRSGTPSGENRVVDTEIALLRAAGHEVEVFEKLSDDIEGWSPTRRVTVPLLTIYNRPVRTELAELLASRRPDVVHVHNTFPMLSSSVLDACAEAAVPVVASVHNYRLLCAGGGFFRDGVECQECAGGNQLPALHHACYRGSRLATACSVATRMRGARAWRERVSAYVFVSEAQRGMLGLLGVPPERSFVKNNAVPSREQAGPRDHVVSYLGRLEAAKGIDVLMAAWDRFCAARPESTLRLAIAGGGELEAAVRAWADAGHRIDVLGQLDPEAAEHQVARSLAVLSPSVVKETFGLVPVEAMAAGVAPIVTDLGSFPELVTDGVNGSLIPPRDPAALAAALASVDEDPARYIALGDAARRTHAVRWAPDVIMEQLLGIYAFAVQHPVAGVRRAARPTR